MPEEQLHGTLLWTVFAMTGLTFASLLLFRTPDGRHYAGKGWEPDVANRTGWIVIELSTTTVFLPVYSVGQSARQAVPLVFLRMWHCHYLNRSLVHPLRTRTAAKTMPMVVVGAGLAFHVINAYVNARFLSDIGQYGSARLVDPRFLAGAAVFAAGLALSIHSDNILLRLRKADETGHAIRRGGAFRYVSCPNYLGEILEWVSWALATWSLAGTGFLRLHRRQPRSESAQPPCLVQGAVLGLPGTSEGLGSGSDLGRCSRPRRDPC